MLNSWRKNLNLKEFSLNHDEPEIFVKCQWQLKHGPSLWYLVYRWLIAIYFLTTWLLSILIVKKKTDNFQLKWLIYLTNWGYTACTFQAFLGAFMLSAYILSYRMKDCASVSEKFLRAYKVYWVLNTVATVLACGITIIYWTLIFDKSKMDLDAMNFFLHAMNSVVMTIDFWIVSHPVKLAHGIYPMGFALIYAMFSAIYYYVGGTSRDGTTFIYPILRWEKPLACLLVCAGVGIFLFVIHSLYFLMHWLKERIHKKLGRMQSLNLTTISDVKCQGYINEAVIDSDQV